MNSNEFEVFSLWKRKVLLRTSQKNIAITRIRGCEWLIKRVKMCFLCYSKSISLQFEAKEDLNLEKRTDSAANTYANDVFDHDHATGFCFSSDAGVIRSFWRTTWIPSSDGLTCEPSVCLFRRETVISHVSSTFYYAC